MIELPETYVLADQINETLVGKTVIRVVANAFPHKFAWYSGDPSTYGKKLSGKKIIRSQPGASRTYGCSTQILCGDMLLAISTPIRYYEPGKKLPAKHHLWLQFSDLGSMTCTVQMWGGMFCYQTDEKGLPEGYDFNKNLTPLEDGFNENYFEKLVSGTDKKLSAKAFLATEQRIPGLGNGVLQDILFNARINPKTRLENLRDKQLNNMYKAVKETLEEMKLNGGRDTEKDLFGSEGGYKTILSNKTANNSCPVCGGNVVREAYLGGNVYYCPACQPWVK